MNSLHSGLNSLHSGLIPLEFMKFKSVFLAISPCVFACKGPYENSLGAVRWIAKEIDPCFRQKLASIVRTAMVLRVANPVRQQTPKLLPCLK